MTQRRVQLIVFFVTAFFLFSCGLRSGIPDLSAEELRKMMDEDANLIVIDTRTQFEYARGHIPRSVFVPEEKFSALKLMLPPEKDTALVFYCRGPG